MPGGAKKKIRQLREKGSHELADWMEEKERQRALGTPLHKWIKENPRPEGYDDVSYRPAYTPHEKKKFQIDNLERRELKKKA